MQKTDYQRGPDGKFNKKQQQEEEPEMEKEELVPNVIANIITNTLLEQLGTPPNYTRTSVKKVGRSHYRVNVLTSSFANQGDLFKHISIPFSFYVTMEQDGAVFSPPIQRRFDHN